MQVNYNDLSQAAVRERYPRIVEQVRKGELALPTVFVDDEMVSAGFVDYFTIAKAIEDARENGT